MDYLAKGFHVYGGPNDVVNVTPPQDFRGGEYRYFGYTEFGNPYTNSDFPVDPGKFPVEEREYIYKPYYHTTYGITYEPDDISNKEWNLIYEQIKEYTRGMGYPENAFPREKEYYGLLAPSISGLHGSVKVIFHRKGDSPKNWRYETINNLVLKYPDYYIQALKIPEMAKPGEKIDMTFVIGQWSEHDFSFINNIPVTLQVVRENGETEQIYSKEFCFGTAESKIIDVSYVLPSDIQGGFFNIYGVINKPSENEAGPNETDYSNNIVFNAIKIEQESPQPGPPPGKTPQPPSSPPEEPQPELGNLRAAGSYYQNGTTTASFESQFNISGRAKVRFYVEDDDGSLKYIDGAVHNFPANGYVITRVDYTTDKTIVAAVNCELVNGSWKGEKFRGDDGQDRTETTYGDNIVRCTPPQPKWNEYQGSKSVTTTIEVTETRPVEKTRDIYGWKKVKFTPDKTKYIIKALLVPKGYTYVQDENGNWSMVPVRN